MPTRRALHGLGVGTSDDDLHAVLAAQTREGRGDRAQHFEGGRLFRPNFDGVAADRGGQDFGGLAGTLRILGGNDDLRDAAEGWVAEGGAMPVA